jgi:CRP-like cAMP-binding protein
MFFVRCSASCARLTICASLRLRSVMSRAIFLVQAASCLKISDDGHTVDGGRTVASYRKNQKVFTQGERADSVFYIREGKVKVCVISEVGKRPSSPSTGTEISSARVA